MKARVLASPLESSTRISGLLLALGLHAGVDRFAVLDRQVGAAQPHIDDGDAEGLGLAGDLVEEGNPPGFNDDCFPMEWPLTLDTVLGLTTAGSTVVPGHGAVVDRAYVEEQRNDIGLVAETIRDLASRGVPVDDALGAASWPFAPEVLAHAVRRGYEHLPRSQKRLPLL